MTTHTRYFVHAGSDVHIIKMNPEVSRLELKPKVYSVNYSDLGGYFLTEIKDRFELPEKVYGDTNRRAEKVIRTFNNRTQSLGALLTGNKGSGKTMLTQVIANSVIDQCGLPVIMVSQPYKGDAFNRFINDVGECVVIFDEFGKMYDQDDQDYLLTFMDGSMSQKRMILLTENDPFLVNDFMMNRPGRILYHFEYGRLSSDVVSELCHDNEVPDDVTADIITATSTVKDLNIDMIKAIISEWQIHQEPIKDIVNDMNIQNRSSREQLRVLKLVDHFGDEHLESELKTIKNNDLSFSSDIVNDSFGLRYMADKDNVSSPMAIDDESESESGKVIRYAGFDFEEHFVHSDGSVYILKNGIGDTVYMKMEVNRDRFTQYEY